MAEKGETKIVAIITILIILISIGFGGCFEEEKHEDGNKEIFHYEIEVINTKPINYTIYFPVPLISRHNHPNIDFPTKLMDELSIEYGEANYIINETKNGFALIIISNQSFKIKGHREIINGEINEDDYVFGYLSMKNGNKGNSPYWIYFNSSSNQSVLLNFESYWRSIPEDCESFEYQLIEYGAKIGWQSIELRKF
jgi:hypothetical protein